MKELFEDLRLSKIAYLLEKIEKGNIDKKIKSFRKLEKYKITKKIGLFLLDNSTRDYNLNDELGGVSSSIIELCFKDYYYEYTDKIREIFDKLNPNAQNRVLYLLSTLNDENALILYADLVLKYYENKKVIPIGELQEKPFAYPYLFPKLYKALKFDNVNNNILILLNSYINSGIVPKEDINKNKKTIVDLICKIFDEALKYKFKTTYEGLKDINYKSLRYFLEIAVNIELLVSNKKTKEYLNKLLKKNDNQLKLFILDNYFRKNNKIDKFNFSAIARDRSSRYALFELLSIYEKTDLMPKKYLNQKLLAESDFYTNFLITTSYTNEPINLEFYKKLNINNLDYYLFKFDYKYKYNNTSADYLTNYICSQIGIEKYNDEEITSKFIGVSGGYNPENKASIIIKNHKKLLCSKIDTENDKEIEILVNELLKENIIIPKEDNKDNKKIKKNKKHNKFKLFFAKKKEKKNEKKKIKEENKLINNNKDEIKNKNSKIKLFLTKKKEKKVEKKKIKEEKKINKKVNLIDDNASNAISKKDKLKVKIFKKIKLKKNKKIKEKITLEDTSQLTEEVVNNNHHIFSYIMLFLFTVFISLLIYWILYVYGVGSLNEGYEERTFKEVALIKKDKFTEISGNDIFNQENEEYYVLLYKGSVDKIDKYYVYINEYLKRDYKFYYVDLSKEENKFLYTYNDLNFVVYTDRLLKVKNHVYDYYVDGKNNILDEMQLQVNQIKIKEKENKASQEKEKSVDK